MSDRAFAEITPLRRFPPKPRIDSSFGKKSGQEFVGGNLPFEGAALSPTWSPVQLEGDVMRCESTTELQCDLSGRPMNGDCGGTLTVMLQLSVTNLGVLGWYTTKLLASDKVDCLFEVTKV